ncbi:hypothetical protein J5226_12880 [Lysobacter sp. K5869]|uniref:terminase small subunit-like protein n=1 Tax=Lysobacter sp. K5869 TaxID=2820808 RepID=UPI001C0645D8|nr:hypothetical protein [Lysobacter sp. K5869]QWP79219.1 hypothetical protein J5226_12880 [Lysobacter sp. K5869]
MSASTYTPELAAQIIERLSKGEPLADICRDEGMPAVRTVSDWRSRYPDFDEQFLAARDDGFDAIAADCLRIADDGTNDYVMTKNGPVFDAEAVQRSKLRVETRIKLLAKWDRRRYGDHITHANDPENPLAGLTDEQLDARLAALAARQAQEA